MASNETQLVNNIRKAIMADYPDAVILKIHGGPQQDPGVPNLVGVVGGRFFGFVVKHQKPEESEEHARGRATVTQIGMLERIKQAGGVAGVVLSVEEVLGIVSVAYKNH
jgi:hypothetical protein